MHNRAPNQPQLHISTQPPVTCRYMMELEFEKNTTSSVFDKLLAELQSTASASHERAQHKQGAFTLMHQLQERK